MRVVLRRSTLKWPYGFYGLHRVWTCLLPVRPIQTFIPFDPQTIVLHCLPVHYFTCMGVHVYVRVCARQTVSQADFGEGGLWRCTSTWVKIMPDQKQKA